MRPTRGRHDGSAAEGAEGPQQAGARRRQAALPQHAGLAGFWHGEVRRRAGGSHLHEPLQLPPSCCGGSPRGVGLQVPRLHKRLRCAGYPIGGWHNLNQRAALRESDRAPQAAKGARSSAKSGALGTTETAQGLVAPRAVSFRKALVVSRSGVECGRVEMRARRVAQPVARGLAARAGHKAFLEDYWGKKAGAALGGDMHGRGGAGGETKVSFICAGGGSLAQRGPGGCSLHAQDHGARTLRGGRGSQNKNTIYAAVALAPT